MLWFFALNSVAILAVSVFNTLQQITSKLKHEGTVPQGQTRIQLAQNPASSSSKKFYSFQRHLSLTGGGKSTEQKWQKWVSECKNIKYMLTFQQNSLPVIKKFAPQKLPETGRSGFPPPQVINSNVFFPTNLSSPTLIPSKLLTSATYGHRVL